MEHLIGGHFALFATIGRNLVHDDAIAFPALDRHPIRSDQPQRLNTSRLVALDLGVSIAPVQNVRHHRLAERERRHLCIRLVVEQPMNGVVHRHSAARCPLKHTPRQGSNRPRQHGHARPPLCQRHRGVFVHQYTSLSWGHPQTTVRRVAAWQQGADSAADDVCQFHACAATAAAAVA